MDKTVSVDAPNTWETSGGIEFLWNLGVEPGHRLVDYGAGSGHYTIPAAQVVGESGIVYAVDTKPDRLEEIVAKMQYLGNHRLVPVLTGESTMFLPFRSDSIDIILAYDILHLLENRTKVYREFHRVLKSAGMLSVHPRHTRNDYPLANFSGLTLDDVRREIESHQFRCVDAFTAEVSHDNQVIPGTIMNFQKSGST